MHAFYVGSEFGFHQDELNLMVGDKLTIGSREYVISSVSPTELHDVGGEFSSHVFRVEVNG